MRGWMTHPLALILVVTTIGCGSQPPPSQIPVDEALAVIKPLEPVVQGCGVMKWDGKSWGLSDLGFQDVQTPWLRRRVRRLNATFADGDEDYVLTAVTIDGHEYRRDSRTEKILTWRRYLGEAP